MLQLSSGTNLELDHTTDTGGAVFKLTIEEAIVTNDYQTTSLWQRLKIAFRVIFRRWYKAKMESTITFEVDKAVLVKHAQ